MRGADELIARDVRVRYPGSTRDAVAGVSLEARRGELVAIVGPNGAGKTTLVSALLGIVEPTSGSVAIDGVSLAALPERERAAHFGLLTQEFGRYEVTVRRSLLLGLPAGDVPDERLWEALEWARAADFVRALPDGLDAQLGQQWGGAGISGGQWQRLSVARIYLRNAGIWILDEPTSAVDAETEAAIFATLAERRASHLTLVISHRASTLRRMDRIYVLDGGVLVQTGTFEELASSAGRFRDLFADELPPPPGRPRTAPETAAAPWPADPARA